jgi:hypothetical protein
MLLHLHKMALMFGMPYSTSQEIDRRQKIILACIEVAVPFNLMPILLVQNLAGV